MHLHDTLLPNGMVRKHVALPRITLCALISCVRQRPVSNPYLGPADSSPYLPHLLAPIAPSAAIAVLTPFNAALILGLLLPGRVRADSQFYLLAVHKTRRDRSYRPPRHEKRLRAPFRRRRIPQGSACRQPGTLLPGP